MSAAKPFSQMDVPDPIDTFIACVGPSGTASTCTLPISTYTLTQAQYSNTDGQWHHGGIPILRSGVIVRGGSNDSQHTMLILGCALTAPMKKLGSLTYD